jgi:hypothetical protein
MTSQYGAYAICTYAHAHAHPLGYSHARTHVRTRKHAHTDEYVILIAFPQQWFRERVSMLRYTTLPVLFIKFIITFMREGTGLGSSTNLRAEKSRTKSLTRRSAHLYLSTRKCVYINMVFTSDVDVILTRNLVSSRILCADC